MFIISGLKKRVFFLSPGQSLIELVVAISVILIGVVSTLVLTLTTIRGGKASEMQVIATNLGREGIEVVRQKRDSNWLRIESNDPTIRPSQWDQGLEAVTDYTALAVFTLGIPPSSSSWSLDYNRGTDIVSCVTDNSCRIYFKNGIYSHDSNGEPTPYYRLITTYEICQDKDGNEYIDPDDHTCNTGDEKIGIQVLSQVKWFEKNHFELMTFEEHLYNWK